MRLHCVFTLAGLLALALSGSLEKVDQRFLSEGASLQILQEYDAILNDLRKMDPQNPTISNVLYKHGLVNFSLKRDKLALQDFEYCLDINPNHQGCLDRLQELCIEMGEYDEAEARGINVDEYKQLEQAVVTLHKNKRYKESIEKAQELINMSPLNMRVRAIVTDCLKHSKLDFPQKVQLLADQYGVLVNNDRSLENYVDLFDLQFFGKAIDIGSCSKVLKTCLKYDNDYKECRERTKMTVKMSKLLDLYEQVSIYYSYLYLDEGDVVRVAELEPSDDVWRQLHNLLFGKTKVRGQESLLGVDLSKYRTNLDVLVELTVKALERFGFSRREILDHSPFLHELARMAKESCIRTGNPYKNKLDYKDEILPEQFEEVDKLLRKKKYGEAKQKLDAMRGGFKKSSLWKQRNEQLSKFREHEQRQRARQQQQQQQQQQYQHYQQYRQYRQNQQPPPQGAPDGMDPYKVLGVSKTADDAEIRKAYREKMKQNHPDKMKNSNLSQEEIEQKVAEINNAYEILSDAESKQRYDQQSSGNHGPGFAGQHFRPPNAGGGAFFQGEPFGFNFHFDSFDQNGVKRGYKVKRKSSRG
ncbi:hypothetical protein KL929_001658 [Ogataea haglerorum]|nr:hypothetical protein KL929_001658 [Ogataea haglerorum]